MGASSTHLTVKRLRRCPLFSQPVNEATLICRRRYYDNEWKAAIAAHARWVGITSFNEWHEGTQIEPAARGKFDAAQKFA